MSGKRVRLWPLLVVLGIESVVLVGFYSLAATYVPPVRLLAADVVSLPGEEQGVPVYIEQDLPPYLRGRLADVEITLGPSSVGSSDGLLGAPGVTDGRGQAVIPLVAPAEAGVYAWRATARPCGSRNEILARAQFLLQVIPEDAKLVVTTLRHTLWNREDEAAVEEPQPPRKDASAVLSQIAESHSVLYLNYDWRAEPWQVRSWLEAREYPPWSALLVPEKIRQWLEGNGFPAGAQLVPSVGSPRGKERWREVKDYLEKTLRGRWRSVAWGFGSSSQELMAFGEAGIQPVHLGVPSPRSSDGPGVRAAEGWEKARELVLGR